MAMLNHQMVNVEFPSHGRDDAPRPKGRHDRAPHRPGGSNPNFPGEKCDQPRYRSVS